MTLGPSSRDYFVRRPLSSAPITSLSELLPRANFESFVMDDRLPIHTRALELFRQGFDSDSAAMIARLELEQRQRLDADERPSRPPGRLVGAERHG